MQFSKELRRRLLIGKIRLFVSAIIGAVVLAAVLEHTLKHENILVAISPVFIMLFLFVWAISSNWYYGREVVAWIHREYAENVINMPFAKLSPAVLNRTLIPYVMPKIFTKIIEQNSVWDEEQVVMSQQSSVLNKAGSAKIKDIKAAYDQLTDVEKKHVEQLYMAFVTAKIINASPDKSLKSLGISC